MASDVPAAPRFFVLEDDLLGRYDTKFRTIEPVTIRRSWSTPPTSPPGSRLARRASSRASPAARATEVGQLRYQSLPLSTVAIFLRNQAKYAYVLVYVESDIGGPCVDFAIPTNSREPFRSRRQGPPLSPLTA
jgi:hypothetical protein